MEQSLHKRVYINPNFKRTNMDPWPKETIATTHFNRHYVKEKPSGIPTTNNNQVPVHNRKIFVNPNFLNSSNVPSVPSKPPESTGYIASNEIVNAPNIPLHKSKYSLVNNSQHIIKAPARNVTETNKISTQASCPELCQYTKKQTQEIPLTRSRYCIVRKKKRLSATLEYKNDYSSAMDLDITKEPLTGVSFNQFTCTSFNTVKNNEMAKLIHKTPEKVTKIKMSKYKIMPVNFLKCNIGVKLNHSKFATSPLKPFFKNTPKLSSCSKSRFRFVKTVTPVKSNTPVSTAKVASRISNKAEKVLASGIKSKLSRANFKINNIPCRLFTKYGKCLRQERGHCKYLHDKKHVALCHKFLKGICHDKNCSLSHELSDKKMPTCYFYLKGMCTKESCPYLHVKLNEKTKICQEFAKGYCESGDKCPFRHVTIKNLKKIKKVPSTSPRSSQNKGTKTKEFKKGPELTDVSVANSEECIAKDAADCRYYKELEHSDDSFETIKPTRCKLGTLPSFIQL